MAKLHFNYATMNAGKSIEVIKTAYNYEENGFKILILKPKIDTKDGDYISSRVGLRRKADILIDKNDSMIDLLKGKINDLYAILIDEVQFLTKDQIEELFLISKTCDVPVICYGLRLNFKGEAFEGSKRLLELSDVLEELPTICECGKIARMVGRKVNGEYVTEGDEIIIDGSSNIEYVPLCGDCYLEKVKKLNFKKFVKKVR